MSGAPFDFAVASVRRCGFYTSPGHLPQSGDFAVRLKTQFPTNMMVPSMTRPHLCRLLLIPGLLTYSAGCDKPTTPASNGAAPAASPWLGIPSAVNQVIVYLHDGTGWLLNKSEVTVKKSSEVRSVESTSKELVADFLIAVHFGGETFETTAKDVPCDNDGIPTEAAVDRLRASVEDIKEKMKRLQN